jgi:hypothetical protein
MFPARAPISYIALLAEFAVSNMLVKLKEKSLRDSGATFIILKVPRNSTSAQFQVMVKLWVKSQRMQ